VPRIAVSGHRGLPADTVRLVSDAVIVALRETGPGVVGLSCLADGANQIFARAVLDSGGEIEAVVPALQYRDGLPAEALAQYDSLLSRAVTVHRLPFTESTSESHMAASEFMIGRAGELWAIWGGKPARGYGGLGISDPLEVIRIADKIDKIGAEGVGKLLASELGLTAGQVTACLDLAQIRGTGSFVRRSLPGVGMSIGLTRIFAKLVAEGLLRTGPSCLGLRVLLRAARSWRRIYAGGVQPPWLRRNSRDAGD